MSCNRVKTMTRDQFVKEVRRRQRYRQECRLRERFEEDHGFGGFNDAEILAVLLSYASGSSDNARLADKLLDNFGNLKAVLEARPEQLMTVKGMDRDKAGLISLAVPLARAWVGSANEQLERIGCYVDAEEYCKKLLIGERVENFYVIALNAECRVIGKRRISTGSISEVNAYPRLVMETALNYNANNIVLCHNHPGGTGRPSPMDIASTKSIQQLLQGVGILVLDHVIVSGDKTYSMIRHKDISINNRRPLPVKSESQDQPFSGPREKNMSCSRSTEKEVSEMPYNRKAFGAVISKLRVQKGLTQENLSGLAGIARSHLAALEKGEKVVKLDTMWRIAEALEISPSELVRKTEVESKNREGSNGK